MRQVEHGAAGERQVVDEFLVHDLPGGGVLRLEQGRGAIDVDGFGGALQFEMRIDLGVLSDGQRQGRRRVRSHAGGCNFQAVATRGQISQPT